MRRGSLQRLHVGRLDWGRRVHWQETNERPPGRDPVGLGAPWVVLGSAGQLGRPFMPRR
jgi:hypothetical protein